MGYKFKIINIKSLSSLSLIALFLFSPILSNAQQAYDYDKEIQDQISSAEDEFSAPSVELNTSSSGRIGQTANISATLNNINPNTTEFLWYLDDVSDQKQSGKAKSEFSFTTSKENHVVRLTILENNKKVAENAVLISSYNISLIWKAETYVPPEYEGKAMPTRGSKVTVTAIPDIKDVDSKELLYTWYLNSESQVRGVLGEDAFSFIVSKSVDFIPVFVEVSNLSGSITVSQAISIPVVRPSVLLYHKTSEKRSELALNNIDISPGKSISVIARPFNFQANNLTDFDYIWEFIGNKAFGDNIDPSLLTLQISENSALGSKNLTLLATSRKSYKERAVSNLTVNIIKQQE
ncbi:MAG: hypothetical protein AAB614_00995 [Patescibacteria group bacterium]